MRPLGVASISAWFAESAALALVFKDGALRILAIGALVLTAGCGKGGWRPTWDTRRPRGRLSIQVESATRRSSDQTIDLAKALAPRSYARERSTRSRSEWYSPSASTRGSTTGCPVSARKNGVRR